MTISIRLVEPSRASPLLTPYAATWYLAMIVLFVAFGEIGLVLGTILQCTRSFITILIGMGLMYLGYAHIEPKQPPRVVIGRLAAGLVMSAAINLYIIGNPMKLFGHPATAQPRLSGRSDEATSAPRWVAPKHSAAIQRGMAPAAYDAPKIAATAVIATGE